jgi:predicted MFS family arabinose efflux permease
VGALQKLTKFGNETVGDMRGRALVVVLGCLVCQMGLAFGYVFSGLATDMLDEMGWTRGEFSFARIPQLAIMAAASPIVGTLVIRVGAKRVLTSAIALLGVTLLLMSRLDGLHQYYALMVLLGVGLTGVGDITVGQTVSQWIERGRGFALGVVYIGSNLGGVLLVPLAVTVAERASWRTALAGLGVGAMVIMLPAALLMVRDADSRPSSAGDARVRDVDVEGDRDLDIRQALRTRSFWILAFSLFAFFFYFLAMLEHMVLFLTDSGLARSQAVALYASAIGLGIWSKLGLGLVADRIPEKAVLVLDYALLTLSSLLLFALPHAWLSWAFVACFGISYAARDVVYPLIVTRCFGLRYMAQIYGALMVTLVLGASGAWFAASVHDRTESYDFAFQVFAGLNLVALGLLTLVRDERPDADPAL